MAGEIGAKNDGGGATPETLPNKVTYHSGGRARYKDVIDRVARAGYEATHGAGQIAMRWKKHHAGRLPPKDWNEENEANAFGNLTPYSSLSSPRASPSSTVRTGAFQSSSPLIPSLSSTWTGTFQPSSPFTFPSPLPTSSSLSSPSALKMSPGTAQKPYFSAKDTYFTAEEEEMIQMQLRIIEQRLRSELLAMKAGLVSPSLIQTTNHTESLFDNVDLNHNSRITYAEYSAAVANGSYEDFNKLDSNNDNVITLPEFQVNSAALPTPVTLNETPITPGKPAPPSSTTPAKNNSLGKEALSSRTASKAPDAPSSRTPSKALSPPETENKRKKSRIDEKTSDRLKRQLLVSIDQHGGGVDAFKEIMRTYDIDGSGKLSKTEMTSLIRTDLKMPASVLNDDDIGYLMYALDDDGSNTISSDELVDFIIRGSDTFFQNSDGKAIAGAPKAPESNAARAAPKAETAKGQKQLIDRSASKLPGSRPGSQRPSGASNASKRPSGGTPGAKKNPARK